MIRSLNEIETVVRKAACGAGLPNGHAEDIGRAAAWLASHGVDGVAATLPALGPPEPVMRREEAEGSVFPSARIAFAGPAALDLLLASGCDAQVRLLDLDAPVLLLGLAGVVAEAEGLAISIDFGPVAATISPAGTDLPEALPTPCCDARIALRGAASEGPRRPRRAGLETAAEAWEAAMALAARTLVPASEASRMRGAGAGLTDND